MATTINTKQDTERAISTHKALATRDLNAAEKLVLNSDADYEKASDMLITVKDHLRVVTQQKRKILDPINQAAKETRSLFKPIETKLDSAKAIISQGMLDYRAAQKAEAEAREAELQAKIDSGEIDIDQALDQIPDGGTIEKTTYGKKGTTTVRTIKDIEITDQAQIPAEYWVIDITRLRQDALGNKAQGIEPREIPGVKIIERESL